MRTSYGLDRYQAGEGDVLARVPGSVARYGCLYFTNYTATPGGIIAQTSPAQLVKHVATAGMPVMIGGWGGSSTWGNDTAVARAETARAYQATAFGTDSSKVVVMGDSMGSILALRYAMAFPTRVAAIGLLRPIPDIQDVYDQDRSGFQAPLGAAYGGRPSDAQNPADNPSAFSAIPTAMWYSTDDPVGVAASVTSFAAASGANAYSIGALGHTWRAQDGTALATFLRQYAA